MAKIILYSTGCPKCKILETKMSQKNINYEVNNDVDLMQEKGFTTLPMLDVDGEMMDFGSAVKWVNGV